MTERPKPVTRRRFLGGAAEGMGAFAAMSLAGRGPAFLQDPRPNNRIRIALVGPGRRGQNILATLGYPDPRNSDVGLPSEPIKGVELAAVCDTFEDNLDQAVGCIQAKGGKPGRYVDYREMLEKEDLDAVIVATSDHMHAQIAMDAARAGCDAYVEKCMANSLEETKELGKVLEETGRIVQVGYQLRQSMVHRLARKYLSEGVIGEVHMIQEFLNRNGPEGAWISPLAADGGPPREKIHWREFLGNAPARKYDPHRYFEWRHYWDYSTGISGDAFSHSLDAAIMLTGLGIPHTAMASGGVYRWKEGNRETPDHYSVVMEYPEQDVSLTYLATLSNGYHGHRMMLFGTEGTMEVSWFLNVYPDRLSERYADKIAAGEMSPDQPFITLADKNAGLIVKAAPSKLWLEGKGMLLTTRDGKPADTTRLHLKNLFQCMHTRGRPDAGYDLARLSTIGCHMSTTSYLEGRRVTWDDEKQEIV